MIKMTSYLEHNVTPFLYKQFTSVSAVYTSQYIFRISNLYKTVTNISPFTKCEYYHGAKFVGIFLQSDVTPITAVSVSRIKMKNVTFTCRTKRVVY